MRSLCLALLLFFSAGCQADDNSQGNATTLPEATKPLFEFDLFPAEGPLRADKVVVYKAARRMDLMLDGKRIRSYRISLGDSPVGHKTQEGDERTPEGDYVIDYRNPRSKFTLSLHISYPNRADRAQAAKRGVSPGGDIMIHGLPNGWEEAGPALAGVDWTDGCIAVDNWAIREIWDAVKDGTPITIHP